MKVELYIIGPSVSCIMLLFLLFSGTESVPCFFPFIFVKAIAVANCTKGAILFRKVKKIGILLTVEVCVFEPRYFITLT